MRINLSIFSSKHHLSILLSWNRFSIRLRPFEIHRYELILRDISIFSFSSNYPHYPLFRSFFLKIVSVFVCVGSKRRCKLISGDFSIFSFSSNHHLLFRSSSFLEIAKVSSPAFETRRCELILRDFSIFFFFFEPSSFDPPFLKSFQYSPASVRNT